MLVPALGQGDHRSRSESVLEVEVAVEAWVEKVRVSLNPRRSAEGGSLTLRIVDLHGWFVAVGHLRYFDHRESMLLVVGGTYLRNNLTERRV